MTQTDIRKFNQGETMENRVKFSHNWNMFNGKGGKLDCKFFTTIRKSDKFSYYEQREGEIFKIYLEEEVYCKAILKGVIITSIDKISPELLVLDTGTMDFKILFEKFHVFDQCILLLFERIP